MFDVSLIELAVIALVALLVLGPEKLPRAARTVGLYARRARNSWQAVRADIERELAADDLKRSMQAHADAVQAPIRAIQRDLSAPLDAGDRLDGPLSRQQVPGEQAVPGATAGGRDAPGTPGSGGHGAAQGGAVDDGAPAPDRR